MNIRNNHISFVFIIGISMSMTSCVVNYSDGVHFADMSPLFFFFMIYILFRIFSKNKSGGPRGDRSRRRERRENRRRSNRRDYRRHDTDYERPRRNTRSTRETYEPPRERRTTRSRPERKTRSTSRKIKNNPYKKSGIEKYKEYDYKGAIEDFEKSLAIDNNDVPTHWNIACALSIMEEKDRAFYHLSKAIELGFKDFEKIKTHDDLAYLRIQDEFETFVQNGYKLKPGGTAQQEKITQNSDLLEQLNKLAELREKGLLTEEEFVLQKKKLLE